MNKTLQNLCVAGLAESIRSSSKEGAPCIVEIAGSEGVGKTELLINIAINSIIPKQWQGCILNGNEVEVIYIDADCKLSLLRLRTILESKIRAAFLEHNKMNPLLSPLASDDIDTLLQLCLQRLYIIQCRTASELVYSLFSLKDMFTVQPDIQLLLIDGLMAYHWVERALSVESLNEYYAGIVKSLQLLHKNYDFITIVTKNIPPAKYEGSQRDYLCKDWNNFPSHRYFLESTAGELTCFILRKTLPITIPIWQRKFFVGPFGVYY